MQGIPSHQISGQKQETASISGSDFYSINDANNTNTQSHSSNRNSSTREQNLVKDNTRIRKQYSDLSQKYIKLTDQIAILKFKLESKDKKMKEMEVLLKTEIQSLKKQLTSKNVEITKLNKNKHKYVGLQKSKQNLGGNMNRSQAMQRSQLLTQSQIMQSVQYQNVKLHRLLHQFLDLLAPYFASGSYNIKQKNQIVNRLQSLKKQLAHKSVEALIQKANQIAQGMKTTTQNRQNAQQNLENNSVEDRGVLKQKDKLQDCQNMDRLIDILKLKINHLKKTPLVYDYDIEKEMKVVDVVFTGLDVQMRLLGVEKKVEID